MNSSVWAVEAAQGSNERKKGVFLSNFWSVRTKKLHKNSSFLLYFWGRALCVDIRFYADISLEGCHSNFNPKCKREWGFIDQLFIELEPGRKCSLHIWAYLLLKFFWPFRFIWESQRSFSDCDLGKWNHLIPFGVLWPL